MRRASRQSLYLVVALLCALAFAPTAGALSLEAYRVNVAEAHTLAAAAGTEMTQREATDLAIAINELVPAQLDVETPQGPFDVDNSIVRVLVATLDAAETTKERREAAADLEAHLASMARTLGTPGDAVPADPDALARILVEQAPQPTSVFNKYLARIIERLGEWLEAWWSRIGESSGTGTVLTVVTIVFVALVAALLLWLAARALMRIRAGSQQQPALPRLADPTDAVIEAARDLPANALDYAEECAARGEMREAVRALFGGAARELQDAGYVVEAHMRTNRELLLEIRPQVQNAYAPLEQLSRAFERAWYGHHEPDTEQFADCRAWFLGVRAALLERGGDGA